MIRVILDLSIIAPNGKYAKYVPSGVISLSRPSLTPSDKKFGCGALYVCVCFAFASDSYAERAKAAEAAERVLLIANSPFGPSGLLGPLTPLQALLLISREAHLTFQF